MSAASEIMRQRALDHEAALGDGVTDIEPWDADWLRQQIAECRATADLLDALEWFPQVGDRATDAEYAEDIQRARDALEAAISREGRSE